MTWDADPVLGAVIASYPIDRLRLLLPAGAVCASLAVMLNFTLAQAPVWWGPALTVAIMAAVALVAGWWVLHLWNREVVLYEFGFSYREGGRVVPFLYPEIASLRQRAERLSYFGGLVRREVYRFTLTTIRGERIVLGSRYRRVAELGVRLEERLNHSLLPILQERLARGERIPFSDTLRLSAGGLHDGERALSWDDFGGFRIAGGQLAALDRGGATWFSLPLPDVDNVALLLELTRSRRPRQDAGA